LTRYDINQFANSNLQVSNYTTVVGIGQYVQVKG